MIDKIKKLKFKRNANLQIEIVPLHTLMTINIDLVSPHRANFYCVFLFENCQPTHFVDFEPVKVDPFSLLFIGKNRIHQFDQLVNYEGKVLIFTEEFFCITENDITFLRNSILFNMTVTQSIIKLNKTNFEKCRDFFKNISDELNSPIDHFKHVLLKNLLHNFFLITEREVNNQDFIGVKKGVDLNYTLLFCDLLEENYSKLQRVNEYAKLICISEKRLGKATSNILGKSPKEIINERIYLEAKRLLIYTHLSIKEIGFRLGFEDPAYFVRYFKKYAYVTPVTFRETHVRNQLS